MTDFGLQSSHFFIITIFSHFGSLQKFTNWHKSYLPFTQNSRHLKECFNYQYPSIFLNKNQFHRFNFSTQFSNFNKNFEISDEKLSTILTSFSHCSILYNKVSGSSSFSWSRKLREKTPCIAYQLSISWISVLFGVSWIS